MSHITLEVCITSAEDAIAAHQAGADRLELNVALSLDGLTPSPGMLRTVKQLAPLPIITMIRPRAGHFVPSDSDFRAMMIDIEWALIYQSSGITFGILTQDRQIDVARCRILQKLIGNHQSVFHRAFDLTDNPNVALEQLIDLGFTRVMTSGGRKTAIEGADSIRDLIERARDRIEILPAGGINPSNVVELVKRTGCTQVHGSFRRPGATDDGTDATLVAQTRALLDSL
jgi:copper homeostasis protein